MCLVDVFAISKILCSQVFWKAGGTLRHENAVAAAAAAAVMGLTFA